MFKIYGLKEIKPFDKAELAQSGIEEMYERRGQTQRASWYIVFVVILIKQKYLSQNK